MGPGADQRHRLAAGPSRPVVRSMVIDLQDASYGLKMPGVAVAGSAVLEAVGNYGWPEPPEGVSSQAYARSHCGFTLHDPSATGVTSRIDEKFMTGAPIARYLKLICSAHPVTDFQSDLG